MRFPSKWVIGWKNVGLITGWVAQYELDLDFKLGPVKYLNDHKNMNCDGMKLKFSRADKPGGD